MKETIWIYHAFVQKEETQHALGHRLLAAALLARYGITCTPEAIRTLAGGKPVLDAQPDIHFNISHSASAVVCALSRKPVGIDIELVRERPLELLSRRVLTAQELDAYLHADDPLDCFYRHWVKKESYLKWTGEGIHRDLRALSYAGAQFFPLDIDPAYRAAVCCADSFAAEIVYADYLSLNS